jgi:membrane-associated phospholipid phosphatase
MNPTSSLRAAPRAVLRVTLLGGVALVAMLIAAHVLDVAAVPVLDLRSDNVQGQDWYRALRVLGYAPVWVVVGLLYVLADSGGAGGWRAALGRGPFIAASAALSGALAEVLKGVFMRGRPDARVMHQPPLPEAERTFDHLFLPRGSVDWSDLGIPSSHTAVAFGAAAALSWLHPRVAPIMLACAMGCGLTRVFSRAHYLSDIVAGALVGWLVCGGMVWADAYLRSRRDRAVGGGA